jgi:hypothetical protein
MMVGPHLVAHIVVSLALALFAYRLGWRTGRRRLMDATVDYILARPEPRRNWEERMLDYAKLQDKRPDAPRIIL